MIIRNFDMLVMPTTDFEEFGYSMAEAMALGIPVVASRVGAIPVIIDDGVNGILVDPKNSGQLSAALELLAEDASYRQKIGKEGRESIMSRFSAKKMAGEYYDFIYGYK